MKLLVSFCRSWVATYKRARVGSWAMDWSLVNKNAWNHLKIVRTTDHQIPLRQDTFCILVETAPNCVRQELCFKGLYLKSKAHATAPELAMASRSDGKDSCVRLRNIFRARIAAFGRTGSTRTTISCGMSTCFSASSLVLCCKKQPQELTEHQNILTVKAKTGNKHKFHASSCHCGISQKVWAHQTDLILDVVLYPSDEYLHHCLTCRSERRFLWFHVIFEVQETSGLVQWWSPRQKLVSMQRYIHLGSPTSKTSVDFIHWWTKRFLSNLISSIQIPTPRALSRPPLFLKSDSSVR